MVKGYVETKMPIVILMILVIFVVNVLLLTRSKYKPFGWFYLGSLAGHWAAWWAYEKFLINCPLTSCNIRPDLALIVPYLLIMSALAIAGMGIHFKDVK